MSSARRPLRFNGYENGVPIGGRTNSILRLRQIIVMEIRAVIRRSLRIPREARHHAVASVTVIDPPPPPLIPTNVVDTTTNSGSGSQPATVSGGGSDTGSNSNTPPSSAFAAGTYNGLFYQTNSDGTPAFDVQTTGSDKPVRRGFPWGILPRKSTSMASPTPSREHSMRGSRKMTQFLLTDQPNESRIWTSR